MRFTDSFALDQFLSHLLNEKDINFIAWAYTPWHAIGVDAFVYDLSHQENEKPKGVIIILPLQEGFIINEIDFVCKNFADVEFCSLDVSSKVQQFAISKVIKHIKTTFDFLIAIRNIRTKKKSKKELYIVSVMDPRINIIQIFINKQLANKYSPVFTLIEEGIGTYMSKKVWKLAIKLERELIDQKNNRNKKSKRFEFVRVIQSKMFEIEDSFLKNISLKCISTKKQFLFNKKQDKLIPIWSVVNSYKSVIEKREVHIEKVKNTGPLVLIVTSTLSEEKIVPLEYELNLIENIINVILQKGLSVAIKPHPRETADKYRSILTKFKSEQIERIQQEAPIEDFFLMLNPLCVIGPASSSLVNAKVLYNIPVICIGNILLEASNDELLKVSWNEFKKLMGNLDIFYINRPEEIGDILDSLRYIWN